MTDKTSFDKFIKSKTIMIETATLRKELTRRVLSELSQRNVKWATKFANAVLGNKAIPYTEKEVQDCDAICDLFTKTYVSNMGIFDSPIKPYDLWKVGELFFVRKDNEDDMQKISDIVLSNRTTPSHMYIVTVSESTLVATKVNTLAFIRNRTELVKPIPTIVNKKEEEPTTAKQVEDFVFGNDEVKPNKVLTLSTLQNHMCAMLDNVQPDTLEEVIIGSRIARVIFCNMYPVKYELFTRYTTTFLSMKPEDFSDDMNKLATQLTIIFSFIDINLNAQLLAYAIYHHHDNAELDINNVVYNIIEVADMLRKDGSI
jgi:hypothetical protein|nr:MAG TPA: hypothetical protein [Caudoviricetes sp.]